MSLRSWILAFSDQQKSFPITWTIASVLSLNAPFAGAVVVELLASGFAESATSIAICAQS